MCKMVLNKDNEISAIFVVISVLVMFSGIAVADQVCRTPNGYAGSCIALTECAPLLNISNNEERSPENIVFLRQSSCGLNYNFQRKVCCPLASEWDVFTRIDPVVFPQSKPKRRPKPKPTTAPSPNVVPLSLSDSGANTIETRASLETDKSDLDYESEINCPSSFKTPAADSKCCGIEVAGADKIIGGTDAAVDQFPWLALLEYSPIYVGGPKTTSCAGSLISSRFVLTAAHCIGIRNKPVLSVRLSEYNTSSYPFDTVLYNGGGSENISVFIIGVNKQIRHQNYTPNSGSVGSPNDIGLLKLSRNAPYTDFIRPICLPTFDINKDINRFGLFFDISGWGSNGRAFNVIKQQAKVPYVSLEECQKTHKSTIHDTHVCAGGENKIDSCTGDSGGPLMYQRDGIYMLIGVVSFGRSDCGERDVAGVYTNVYKYLDWINSTIHSTDTY